MKKIWILILLAGCTFGPDHEAPVVCMPDTYKQGPEECEEVDLSTWWEQFEDPLLNAFVTDALACNYDLRIALQRIEEVRGLYRIDRSLLYPQIQGNFVALRTRGSETLTADVAAISDTPAEVVASDFGTGSGMIQNFYQMGLDASWEIDIWGKNRKFAQAAFHEFEASQEEALAVQISLISDVATSYVDIRTLQQQILAKKEQIERQEELLELAETRYQAGLASHVDATQAKARLEFIRSTLPPLEEQLEQTIHGLAVFLGRPPECLEIEVGSIPIAVGRIPCDLPSTLLCRRPDIRQVERELAAATARIGVAIAELFPSFSLTGNFGVQSTFWDKLFIWPSRFWTIGPNMVWNLFTGGRLLGQIQVANERQKQAILAYEKAVITALQDVENSLIGFYKEEERLEAQEERLEANSLLRDYALDQYLAGLVSFDDVLDAERDLYIVQQVMIESSGTLMLQLIGLYKSLGGGWQCFAMP